MTLKHASVLPLLLCAATAAAQSKVDPKELKLRPADFADATVILEETYAGSSKVFTTVEKTRGFRADDYLRLHLLHSGLPAMLTRTPANEALVKALESGAPITVKGTVRQEQTAAQGFTELDITLPGQRGTFFEITAIQLGWARPAPFKKVTDATDYAPATTRELTVVPERFAGKPVKVEVEVGDALHFSRTFTSAEQQLGMTQQNTIKMMSLFGGLVFYVEKTQPNVDLVLGLEKGDKLTVLGRLVSDQKAAGEHYRFVVDRIALR